MRKSQSDSTSSWSCSSFTSNSLSPSSSFDQKPPLSDTKPRPFKRVETVEPIQLESALIIQNKENKVIPVDPKKVCPEVAPKRLSISSGIDLLKIIEAEEKINRPVLDENRNEIVENVFPQEKVVPMNRRPAYTPTKQEIAKQITKLNDPSCPSTTQSKSFQLLQKAMDSGDKCKDLVYYNTITKKTEVRRFSLDANSIVAQSRRLSKVNINNQDSIEENTDQNTQHKHDGRMNRSQSITRDILNQSSYFTNLKPNSSNNFNQRRHSYMYPYGSKFNSNY